MPRPQKQKQKNTERKSDATFVTPVQRPRTRAWVKQEAERKRLENDLEENQPGPDERDNRSKQSPEVRPSSFPDRVEEAPIATVDTPSAHPLRTSESRHSLVPLWLSGVSPPSKESSKLDLPGEFPPISFLTQSPSDMESSSSASKTSAVTSEDASTVKEAGSRKLSWEKLRMRRVSKVPRHDGKSEHVRASLVVEPLRVKFKDVTGLRTILQDFIDECEKSRPNKDSYQAIEALSNKINEWKPNHRLAAITNRDFDRDVTHCKSSNEAVIQRTVMISIIDRWQLHELFDYNCEGQWKLNPAYLLPTTGRKHRVSLPKPDLAIFFKLNALTGTSVWAPYPNEIGHCLRPDGGDERCFPFFFMEVKKAAGDLESAFRANLHSASQALFNIFVWMARAEQTATFFDHVRVFTMDLNAQEIKIRMHRAVSEDQKSLSFHFDDIVSLNGYNKDQACRVVRNILVDYAGKELHGILQTTFEEVSRQEQLLGNVEAKPQSKRKADLVAAQSSKRSRSRVASTAPASPSQITSDTTSSFGASGLNLAPTPQ